MIGHDKLAEERKRRSIKLTQAIKEYGNAQKASWKPRARHAAGHAYQAARLPGSATTGSQAPQQERTA